MATRKQIEANRKNAKKGGVKTAVGKIISSRNGLTHGLLAREAVIESGDGQENRSEFDSLMADLRARLQPDGVLEEMLVEKIAVSYWRYRRAIRYETGLLRSQLDHFIEEYYAPMNHLADMGWKSHRSVQDDLDYFEAYLCYLQDGNDSQHAHIDPEKASEDGWVSRLEESYKTLIQTDEVPWQNCFMTPDKAYDLRAIYYWLIDNGWTRQNIKVRLVSIAQDSLKQTKAEFEKARTLDLLCLDQIAKKRALPVGDQTDIFIRYETAILRQFYRAMHELERLQSFRRGLTVPPPVTVDVEGPP